MDSRTRATVLLRLALLVPTALLLIGLFLLQLLAARITGALLAAGLCVLCWHGLRHTSRIARGDVPAELRALAGPATAFVLAAGFFYGIVLPKLGRLDLYVVETGMRSSLGVLRMGYAESFERNGRAPERLEDVRLPADWTRFPALWRSTLASMPHRPTREVFTPGPPAAPDSGRWGYRKGASDPVQAVFIDCTHTDSKGTAWSAY